MEEPAKVFRRNLLEKLSRSRVGVAARPEVCGQKRGTSGRKNPIFERSGSHVEQPNFLFPQWRREVAVHFHQSSASRSQHPAGILLGTAFGAREVPSASDLTFSHSAAGTGRGEPQKGKAGFETHHLDPDKMKQGK